MQGRKGEQRNDHQVAGNGKTHRLIRWGIDRFRMLIGDDAPVEATGLGGRGVRGGAATLRQINGGLSKAREGPSGGNSLSWRIADREEGGRFKRWTTSFSILRGRLWMQDPQ